MKILIIQLRRIGDILLTTPVVTYLKKTIPNAEIDFLCEPMGKSVLETNPNIRSVILYDKKNAVKHIKETRAANYDVVFDFMNNPRSGYLTALSGAKWRVGYKKSIRSLLYNLAMPIPKTSEYGPVRKIRMVRYFLEKANITPPQVDDIRPSIHLTDQDLQFAEKWFQGEENNGNKFAVMATGSRQSSRIWPAERYHELAIALIKNNNLTVYLAWGPGEENDMKAIQKGESNRIRLLPPTTLRQLAAILKKASFLVSNCSGNMHIGVAAGVPTITLYGPTRPRDWNPSLVSEPFVLKPAAPNKNLVMQAPTVDCLGCHYNECPVGHHCMNQLSSSQIYNACNEILKGEN